MLVIWSFTWALCINNDQLCFHKHLGVEFLSSLSRKNVVSRFVTYKVTSHRISMKYIIQSLFTKIH